MTAIKSKILRRLKNVVLQGFVFGLITGINSCVIIGTNLEQVEQWQVFELSVKGPEVRNPYADVNLSATFYRGIEKFNIKGFYGGDDIYKIRFMPKEKGIWKYITTSNICELDKKSGKFKCTSPSNVNHGPVKLLTQFHFSYEDGSSYYPVGTTLYCWELENYEETLQSLKGTGINKVRYMPFPHRGNKLPIKPFEGKEHEWNFYKPNPAFWQMIDQSVIDLGKLGIQADFILFHPYDRKQYGLDKMNDDERKFYLEYVVARLSAYQNVWWSMANEFDLIDESTEYWNKLGQIVSKADPYGHMHSIHGLPGTKYDWHQPWATHVSYQISKDATELKDLHKLRTAYGKPVLLDEYGYEGNAGAYWGKLSGEKELRRHWTSIIQGCYATHGESWGPENYFWKGGTPMGESFKRISWMGKEIFENSQKPVPSGFTNIDSVSAGSADDYFIYYFGDKKISSAQFNLPLGKKFQVDVIDTWNMTVTEAGKFQGSFEIQLLNKPFIAVRMTEVNNNKR